MQTDRLSGQVCYKAVTMWNRFPMAARPCEFVEKQKPRAVIIDAASMRTTGTRICSDLRKRSKKLALLLILPEKNSIESE